VRADEIPVAHTPPGLWTEMPPPVLAGCTEPLAPGAPDLRGTWRAVRVERGGEPLPVGSPELDHVERIEQCGDRVVVTSSGVVHDMRADGVPEHGVHDVSAVGEVEIHVTASFEDERLVLRPEGIPVEVVRWREGDQLVWEYGPLHTTWMERIDR
jgi:hypothetical protein